MLQLQHGTVAALRTDGREEISGQYLHVERKSPLLIGQCGESLIHAVIIYYT